MPGTGTVTLLFTDLVGSTESLVALGEDRYDSVRDEHEVLVGGTIAAYQGEVVKSTGDGYMAVFPGAADAVAAAAEIQRLVSWPPRPSARSSARAAAHSRAASTAATP